MWKVRGVGEGSRHSGHRIKVAGDVVGMVIEH